MTAERILVIDDDHNICDIMKLALESSGYTAETAYDPRDGMAKACSNPPALILLDYNMPGKDGITLMKDFRTIPELVSVPVIIVSAISMPEIVNAALAEGVSGYLVKPFDLKTLLASVEKSLNTAVSAE
jgi:two-component system chemotaxis response regulator CheY